MEVNLQNKGQLLSSGSSLLIHNGLPSGLKLVFFNEVAALDTYIRNFQSPHVSVGHVEKSVGGLQVLIQH